MINDRVNQFHYIKTTDILQVLPCCLQHDEPKFGPNSKFFENLSNQKARICTYCM